MVARPRSPSLRRRLIAGDTMASSCTMIAAETYGVIDRLRMLSRLTAPPDSAFAWPSNPRDWALNSDPQAATSTPGSGM